MYSTSASIRCGAFDLDDYHFSHRAIWTCGRSLRDLAQICHCDAFLSVPGPLKRAAFCRHDPVPICFKALMGCEMSAVDDEEHEILIMRLHWVEENPAPTLQVEVHWSARLSTIGMTPATRWTFVLARRGSLRSHFPAPAQEADCQVIGYMPAAAEAIAATRFGRLSLRSCLDCLHIFCKFGSLNVWRSGFLWLPVCRRQTTPVLVLTILHP